MTREQLAQIRTALAAMLCADEEHCPTLREARLLCVEAMRLLNTELNMNTEELNMTTQDLIKNLRELLPLGPQIAMLVNEAADRLEELLQERDEARAEVERLKADAKRLTKELWEAKGWRHDWRPDWVRKDPSRLEIAAQLMAHSWPHDGVYSIICNRALEQADALIAAAREGK